MACAIIVFANKPPRAKAKFVSQCVQKLFVYKRLSKAKFCLTKSAFLQRKKICLRKATDFFVVNMGKSVRVQGFESTPKNLTLLCVQKMKINSTTWKIKEK